MDSAHQMSKRLDRYAVIRTCIALEGGYQYLAVCQRGYQLAGGHWTDDLASRGNPIRLEKRKDAFPKSLVVRIQTPQVLIVVK
jgi:hypothetical protein